jgi:two-component system chemotaxis response regulator CheB
MIRILIVDDSPSAAEYLAGIFSADQEFCVAGIATSGAEGIGMVERLRPDIVSMDFTMPDMNGFEATRRIMSSCPTPIVIVSSLYDRHAVSLSFRALEAGALSILPKPPSISSPEFPRQRQELVRTFKAMAGVRVIRRSTAGRATNPPSSAPKPRPAASLLQRDVSLVAVGASTGGPQVIQQFLSKLPADFPVPILIVQHITPGFTEGMAAWLGQSTPLPVTLATAGDIPRGGHVYLAPQGRHLEIAPDGRLQLTDALPEHGACPSVSRLFRSVASVCAASAVGILLTGMGRDGAAELLLMRKKGALTIAQDRESSIVHGMPGEAIRLGGASLILPPPAIALLLANLSSRNGPNPRENKAP